MEPHAEIINLNNDELEAEIFLALVEFQSGNAKAAVDWESRRDRHAVSKAEKKSIRDRVLAALKSKIGAADGTARKTICVDFDYCERRKSDEVDLILTLADAAIMTSFGWWCPPVLIVTYIVRNRMLDPYCGCE